MKKIFLFSFVFALIAITTPLHAAALSGQLVKGSGPEIFLLTIQGELRWIPDEKTFTALGFTWSQVAAINDQELLTHSFGATLSGDEMIERSSETNSVVVPSAQEIEAKVRQVFADAPIMVSVAKCESGLLQFRSDGSLVRSPNGLYIGVFQIDENIHGQYAMSLGLDITTVDGNLAYARHLYDQKGSQPWPACSAKFAPIKNDLKMGDESPEVIALQEILNRAGYTIAPSGPGSAGNETEYFGALTRDAVRRFQCDKGIVCSGDENSTGYGQVGPRTRGALLN